MALRSLLFLLIVVLVACGAAVAQDRYFDSAGIPIRYLDQGMGEPLVLLHGFSGSTEDTWVQTGVIRELVKDFRVIALDARGHGKSGKPHDPQAYGPNMAEDVVRLLNHLGIEQAHVIGYSMGGRLVQRLLVAHPERLLTATLVGFGAGRNWSAADEKHMEERAREADRGSFRTLVLSTAPADGPPLSHEEIEERSRAIARHNDPRALAAVTRNLRGLAVTDAEMAAVRVPTLAVVGSLDAQAAHVRELKTVMSAMTVVIVENAVHDPEEEQGVLRKPELVDAIRSFIASQKGAARR